MFEERGKYEFTKFDQNARTQVMIEEKKDVTNSTQESDAHKRLFNYRNLEAQTEKLESTLQKTELSENIIDAESHKSIEDLEQQQETTTVDFAESNNQTNFLLDNNQEQEQEVTSNNESIKTNSDKVDETELNYISLLQETNVSNNEKLIKKELEKASPKPKKNFSFRIKLFAGVYVILLVLFGGWVIGNAVDIAQTSSLQSQTIAQTEQVSQNIFDIVTSINNLNNASGNPEDETLLVKIATEEIEITPSETVEPNEYKQESNWFDAFTNWIGGIFGGK